MTLTYAFTNNTGGLLTGIEFFFFVDMEIDDEHGLRIPDFKKKENAKR